MTTQQEISQKNTKKEILEAYEKLKEQLKAEKQDGPEEVQQQKHTKKVIEDAEQMIPNKVMKDISNLKIELNQSLEKVAEQIKSEYQKLNKIQKRARGEDK